jgi:hypothetical protein
MTDAERLLWPRVRGKQIGPVGGSFPGRRIQDGLRTTATMPANIVLPFFSHPKLSGASTKLSFVARKKSVPRRLPWLAGPGQVSVVDEKTSVVVGISTRFGGC